MAASARVGSEKAVEMERTGGAMERFGGAGMALLPWTRHMIAVLWDQLRLLVQVIYYTFISVFQMFRFEVHVRITDDPSVASDPSDPFLFSSLFSDEGGADPTEALLSTLRGEELCCDGEGGIYIGGHKRPSGWTATVGDWNFFVSSSETRSSDEERSAASCWSSEEEHLEFDCDESKALWESLSRSGDPYDPFCFSACISTRSKTLWETPVHDTDMGNRRNAAGQKSEAFWETESISVGCFGPDLDHEGLKKSQRDSEGLNKEEGREFWERESTSSALCSPICEKTLVQREKEESNALWETESTSADTFSPVLDDEEFEESWEMESRGNECTRRGVPVGRFWESSSEESSDAEDSPCRGALVSRSDSNSSWSSDNSENSEMKEENQLLWDLFTNQNDPYNPLCFSATARGAEEERNTEEELWRGLTKEQDPYHPLNFTALDKREVQRKDGAEEAPLTRDCKPQRTQRRKGEKRDSAEEEDDCKFQRRRGEKPSLTQRGVQRHTHPQVILRPWTKPSFPAQNRSPEASSAPRLKGTSRTQRKVRFCDVVQVHVMRSWDFARRSSRRGLWEELARDRDRFKRRIQDSERTVGPCLSPEHRDRVWKRIQTGLDQD